ncbi:Rhs-family protein [Minicystis rosea]|nr:Rhs-family protein [Minicystis rosea]
MNNMPSLARKRSALFLILAIPALARCGSGGTETGSTGADGGGHASGSSSSASGTGGDGAGGNFTTSGTGTGGGITTGCPSGIICGDGDCCAAGDECVGNACLPACAPQVRCGTGNTKCCGADELCLGEQCVAATTPCLDYADCADAEFCEPTLGKCVPQAPGAPICEYKPPVGPLTPKIEWSWTSSTIQPNAVQVINMPVVIDLENDGHPDVVVVTSEDFSQNGIAYVRALNGTDGTEKWPATADVYKMENRANSRGTPAAADLDGDGKVEIVTPKSGGGLIAFNHDGSLRWVSKQKDGTTPWLGVVDSATVAIADLDADGSPEIIVAGVVFDSTGKLIADGGAHVGGHDSSYGSVTIVADVNGDGKQEIITGKSAFDVDATGVHVLWDNAQSDGYPAVADLDGDGKPEIVVVSNSTVRVQSGATGAVLATSPFPTGVSGAGGPPTIADFDGDGKPDFSTAGGNAYMVFRFVPGTPAKIELVWKSTTQDISSNRTGSSVFDFQGDGSAEVVYGDECYFRIYSGKDGTVLFQDPSSSGTIHEYPVIADVDGDNNTEIVVVSNDLNHKNPLATCPTYTSPDQIRHGVFVYGDADDKWVRTRRIWNQHAYHLTNIAADGSVPHPEPVSWVGPQGLNNYRQSSQGAGVYNAPDLQVSLGAGLAGCPGSVHLEALVQNHGSLGVAAGVDVSFYAGTSPNGTLISSAKTTIPLLPGQYEVVSTDWQVPAGNTVKTFYVVVDGAESTNAVSECLEDNNQASVDGVSCPKIN